MSPYTLIVSKEILEFPSISTFFKISAFKVFEIKSPKKQGVGGKPTNVKTFVKKKK